MRTHQKDLLELLSLSDLPPNLLQEKVEVLLETLNPHELAQLFVDVAFITSALRFIQEAHWVQSQKPTEVHYAKFIKKYLGSELAPILFFHSFFETSSAITDLEPVQKNALVIEACAVKAVKKKTFAVQKIFAITAMRLMSELYEFEHQLHMEKESDDETQGLSLYRTFDHFDEIFGINYDLEKPTDVPANNERLFSGSGVGVQSSYATVLMVLRYLKINPGSKFVDLGSGYGRVGFAVGLMRPDIHFIGYEFVEDRVKSSNEISKNFSMLEHVEFHTQDLSSADFKIPVAEVYYIYDSFSAETYRYVLSQLNEISNQKKITVITKGDAKQWLMEITQKGNWSAPQQFSSGNFCLFRSK